MSNCVIFLFLRSSKSGDAKWEVFQRACSSLLESFFFIVNLTSSVSAHLIYIWLNAIPTSVAQSYSHLWNAALITAPCETSLGAAALRNTMWKRKRFVVEKKTPKKTPKRLRVCFPQKAGVWFPVRLWLGKQRHARVAPLLYGDARWRARLRTDRCRTARCEVAFDWASNVPLMEQSLVYTSFRWWDFRACVCVCVCCWKWAYV